MTLIPSPLVFTYQDGEPARVRKEARRSYARAADGFSLWALVVSMIFVIGLAVLGAQKAGMLTAANVPPVLLAAYLAYACGVALMVLVSRIYQRQLERAATTGQVESERQIAVSDAGVVAKAPTTICG